MAKEINPYQSPEKVGPVVEPGGSPPRLTFWRGALGLQLGILYGVILFVVGNLAYEASYSRTPLLIYAALSPFSVAGDLPILIIVGLGFWPLVGLVAAMRRMRYWLIGLLVMHYCGLPFVLYHEPGHGTAYLARSGLLLIWTTIYLAGQIVLWLRAWKMNT